MTGVQTCALPISISVLRELCEKTRLRTFRVDAELCPSGGFKYLLKRPVSTGESNEPTRTSGHLDLTLVHRVHNDLYESEYLDHQ